MSYVLTIFLGLFIANSDELTPIHIWLIEFCVLAAISCIMVILEVNFQSEISTKTAF